MGAVPQSGDRYQVVIGGAVQTTFQEIMNLPAMKNVGSGELSDADVKAAERAKARGIGNRPRFPPRRETHRRR